jgi:DNA polymerase-3 subunit gamma/tau
MRYILDDKGITYDDAALAVIAQAAEGGMRDALSILDQVLSFGDNHVTVDNALAVTGGVAASELGALLAAVTGGDTAGGLTAVAKLLALGKDAGRLIEDLIEYLRDLLVYQQAPALVAATDAALRDEHFKPLAETLSGDRIYQMIAVLNETQQQLRLTNHPALYLQVATVRLGATSASAPTAEAAGAAPAELAQLQEQVTKLQQTVAKLRDGQATAPVAVTPKRPKASPQVNTAKLNPILAAATKADLAAVRDIWPDLLSMLTVTKRAMMKISNPVAASPSGVIVSFDYDILVERAENDTALMTELEAGLTRLMGKELSIVLVQKDAWPKVRKAYLASHGAPQPKAKPAAPSVAKPLTDLFGDQVTIEDN